jgi:hypothetical protein
MFSQDALLYVSADEAEDLTSTEIAEYAINAWIEDDFDHGTPPHLGDVITLRPTVEEYVEMYYDPIALHGLNRIAVIPVTEMEQANFITKTFTLPVSVEEVENLRDLDGADRQWVAARNTVRGKLSMEDAVNIEVVSLPKPVKAAASVTDGERLTFFRVVSLNDDGVETIEEGFNSQADARAFAVTLMNSPEGKQYERLDVRAYIQRDTGEESLVTVTRPVQKTADIEISVTTAVPVPRAKVVGYYVSFWYSK